MAETMNAWTMESVGRDRLRLTTARLPRPRRGGILAKGSAVALNHRDKMVIETRLGLPLAFPGRADVPPISKPSLGSAREHRMAFRHSDGGRLG